MARTKASQIGLNDGGYDPTEIPNKVWVRIPADGGTPAQEALCLVIGQGTRFPKVVLPGGGTVEFARQTIIDCHKAGRSLQA